MGKLNFFFLSFFFCPYMAAPVAYGGSQPRGLIGVLLPAYTTATATPDPTCVCDLYHSSGQHRILNPLSEVRDQTHNLMVPSRIHFCRATMGTLKLNFLMVARIKAVD